MNLVIKKYSTPLITGLFLVSAISGTALFFHWQSGWFHSMHIWLSMVLLVPFFLHLWRNWPQFLLYFRNKSMLLACLLSFVAAGAFMLTSGHRGGNPAMRFIPVLTQAPLTDLAPLLHTSPDALAERLTHAGYPVHSPADTLDTLAAASGQQASTLLLSLLPQHGGGDEHRHGNKRPS